MYNPLIFNCHVSLRCVHPKSHEMIIESTAVVGYIHPWRIDILNTVREEMRDQA